MIKRLLAAGAVGCALLAASLALGQTSNMVANPPGTYLPSTAMAFGALSSSASFVTDQTPLPAKVTVIAATSTAQSGSVTSAAVTPTSGTATFAAGAATIGPLTPQLGRPVRVVLAGTWSGSFTAGTSSDGCVTINPLTVGGLSWGSFTANANEDIDTPMVSTAAYCAKATVTSGTMSYSVQQ
jgi:hypothetical protein